VVGYLAVGAGGRESGILDAFRRGLSETGNIDGKDVLIEQRVGDGKTDQLPAFAADLVNHRVTAIAALGLAAAHAAKAATTDIPIIFLVGADPVKAGFVTSFNRPDGNATGIMFFTSELEAKRLGLLHEIAPNAKKIAVLANPANPVFDQQLNEIASAARSLGLALIVQRVGSEHDIDVAFADFAQRGAEALLVAAAPFFL
jgi:putative tryptophan/tyrosine transport system substrate-binding protein